MSPIKENISENKKPSLCPTGISGLDQILCGGLPASRLYVIQGEPGSGKTTLALQFLLEAVKQNERSLYITFSETRAELVMVADSHNWDISKINIIDLSVVEKQMSPEAHTTLFHPSEIELSKFTNLLLDEISRVKPSRIVFDSVSEMRLLAEQPLRYRRQILGLKQALSGQKATILFLDDLTNASQDQQVQSIAHGVIGLYRLHHEFGGERRRLRILKLRGVKFVSGNHDYNITTGGIAVFPRMTSADYDLRERKSTLSSGIAELDSLFGGGIDHGTSNLFIGPAGSGKSTLAAQFAVAAARGGETVAYFAFEESLENLKLRCRATGLALEPHIESQKIFLQKIDPAELSPGEFASAIKNRVEKDGASVVLIDSLNGYVHAMPQEEYLTLQLHELLAYLSSQGVATILVLAQQGLIGNMHSPIDITYLADTVVLTRYFEAMGAVRKAVSVLKKRTGTHESTLREFTIGKGGVKVGAILDNFQGVLTGVPTFKDDLSSLLREHR